MKNKLLILSLIFILILSIFPISCNSKASNASEENAVTGYFFSIYKKYDEKPMLENTAIQITAMYADLNTRASAFHTAITSYTQECTAPYSKLVNLQTLWKENMQALKKTEFIQFGPAVLSANYELMDAWVKNRLSYPPDTASIESFISSTTTIDSTTIAGLGKLLKGMPAIEYLLFTTSTSNTDNLDICNALGGRRLSYLKEIINNYTTNTTALSRSWNPDGGNFSKEIYTAGEGSQYYSTRQKIIDTIIESMATQVEFVKDDKLGYPVGIGIDAGGVVRLNAMESKYSANSIENMINNLEGIRIIFSGNGGVGISDYVSYYNPGLSTRIINQIQDVKVKLQSINHFTYINTNPDTTNIQKAIDSLNLLKSMLTTEINATVGNSSITTTSAAADGD